MKKKTALVVVDVQPAFDDHCRFVASKVAARINNTRKPVVIFWVGCGLSSDAAEDVWDYLHRHGARPAALNRAVFIEKDFGFYRTWLDNGISDDVIVTVARRLLDSGLSSSSMLPSQPEDDDETLTALSGLDEIHVPQIYESTLEHFNSVELCGGGRKECLKELSLWFRARRFSAITELEGLIYG